MKSILFSFAHPDDEAFLVAGVACAFAEAGVHTALSTATLGQAGKCGDPPLCSREDLPAMRERELRAAARLLRLGEPILLGYRDRELANVDVIEIREKLVRVIRQHKPQVVVTFDTNGSNGHPDHVAISRFTSDAIAAARDPRWSPDAGDPHDVQRLLWPPPLRPWLYARMDHLAGQPGVDFAFDVTRWSATKVEALRAHRTQHLNTERVFFSQPDPEKLVSLEVFRQAWGPALRSRPSHDLFEGIDV